MRVIEDKVFRCKYDQPRLFARRGNKYKHIELHRCAFESCALSITKNPQVRTTVSMIAVRDCSAWNCDLGTAIIEDACVENLETTSHLLARAAVFKHVTLRGAIGSLLLSDEVEVGTANPNVQIAFNEANAAYYSCVGWALDISAAEFEEADLRSVPGHLVRRDPETQVLVTRERATKGDWQGVDLSGTYWDVSLQIFLNDGRLRQTGKPLPAWDSTVLVAPKGAPNFRRLLRGLQRLREAGIAEPD